MKDRFRCFLEVVETGLEASSFDDTGDIRELGPRLAASVKFFRSSEDHTYTCIFRPRLFVLQRDLEQSAIALLLDLVCPALNWNDQATPDELEIRIGYAAICGVLCQS
jgi:hypothetical protein